MHPTQPGGAKNWEKTVYEEEARRGGEIQPSQSCSRKAADFSPRGRESARTRRTSNCGAMQRSGTKRRCMPLARASSNDLPQNRHPPGIAIRSGPRRSPRLLGNRGYPDSGRSAANPPQGTDSRRRGSHSNQSLRCATTNSTFGGTTLLAARALARYRRASIGWVQTPAHHRFFRS